MSDSHGHDDHGPSLGVKIGIFVGIVILALIVWTIIFPMIVAAIGSGGVDVGNAAKISTPQFNYGIFHLRNLIGDVLKAILAVVIFVWAVKLIFGKKKEDKPH